MSLVPLCAGKEHEPKRLPRSPEEPDTGRHRHRRAKVRAHSKTSALPLDLTKMHAKAATGFAVRFLTVMWVFPPDISAVITER